MKRIYELRLPRILHAELLVARISAVFLMERKKERGRKSYVSLVGIHRTFRLQSVAFCPVLPFHFVPVWLQLSGFLGERFLRCSRGTERHGGWAGSGNAFASFRYRISLCCTYILIYFCFHTHPYRFGPLSLLENLEPWTRSGCAHGPATKLCWHGFVYGQAAAAPMGQLALYSFVHGQAAAVPKGQPLCRFVHGQASAAPKGQPVAAAFALSTDKLLLRLAQ